jgi:hypothetical protein
MLAAARVQRTFVVGSPEDEERAGAAPGPERTLRRAKNNARATSGISNHGQTAGKRSFALWEPAASGAWFAMAFSANRSP